MKKFFILFIIIIIFSCSSESIIKEKEKIDNVSLSLSLDDQSSNIEVYHIYLKHVSDKTKSIAVDYFDLSDDISLSVFPGMYNLYSYGLVTKTETSKQVYSYSILNNIGCFSDKNINIKFDKLSPDAVIQTIEDKFFLKINMNELSEIFSLSSLSLKQGNDRYRSLTFHKENNYYIAEVPFYENGKWYMNISYLLLSSKKNDETLEKDNIYISTSHFSDIYLGEYN